MPFKLFEFLKQFMIGAFLITISQLEKPGSTGKILIPQEFSNFNTTFETRNRLRFLRHFHVRIWRVLFTSLSAEEFQLNCTTPKCINIVRLS